MQYRPRFAAIVVETMTLSGCTSEPKYIRPEATFVNFDMATDELRTRFGSQIVRTPRMRP